jgi:hypothetical protein
LQYLLGIAHYTSYLSGYNFCTAFVILLPCPVKLRTEGIPKITKFGLYYDMMKQLFKNFIVAGKMQKQTRFITGGLLNR